MSNNAERKCGVVAVAGAPNAGKSTLVNRMVGAKIAIVTHKVQTTRTRLRGVVIAGDTQIVLTDTPGIFVPKRKLDQAMVNAAWNGIDDADEIMLLVDVDAYLGGHRLAIADTERIIEGLTQRNRKAILVLNKIDAVKSELLLQLTEDLNASGVFSEIYMISALSGDGVADLTTALAAKMKPGPWLYPEDQIADAPQRVIAAEITREKLIRRLHDEMPYATTVETETWKTLKDGSIRIEQVIFVERDSQKPIVLGKGGQTIKEIGKQAREDLAEMLEVNVHLILFVKVRAKWAEDPERYRMMGLDLPKG